MTAKEVAAYICSHVFSKAERVRYVSRADGDWQLLCGGIHEEQEKPRIVGLNHLFADDPTLEAIRDLPAEWEAERDRPDAPWRRTPIA